MCILTLRYDPNSNSNYPKLDFNNTKMKPEENYVDLVEDIIQEVFDKELNKQETICTSLSSGIDSTLLTALLKHHFPEQKIHAISVKFSESNDESETAKKIADK